MTDRILVSIVVATRNRANLLSRLLDALTRQVNAPTFEIIIGDNGSSDNTSQVIEDMRGQLRIQCVREERPGKSRAINAALKLAQGDLIVFTDDDTVPENDWLFQLYSASQRYPLANIFGGQITVDVEHVPSWIKRSFNLMGLLTSAHQPGESIMIYPYEQYPLGPNMAIRRHLIADEEAPYPVHLGPGTHYPVGDETGFLMPWSPPASQDRIFIPAAKVFHQVEKENFTLLGAIKRCFMAGKAQRFFPLPDTVQREEYHASTWTLIFSRLGTCKSFRELICISVRYVGFLWGRCHQRSTKT